MNKLMKWFLIVLVLIVNFIVVIDTILYLLMSPEISIRMLGIFIVLLSGLNLAIYRLKTNKKVITVQWLLILMYCVFVMFFSRITAERERSLWAVANVQLDYLEEGLQDYYENNNKCPSSLEEIAYYFTKPEGAFRDPFSKNNQLKYKVLDDNSCMVYSIGMNRVDGGGAVPLNKGAIDFSPKVIPWSVMPFGKLILHISGFDEKIQGDIVRLVDLKNKLKGEASDL